MPVQHGSSRAHYSIKGRGGQQVRGTGKGVRVKAPMGNAAMPTKKGRGASLPSGLVKEKQVDTGQGSANEEMMDTGPDKESGE